MKNTVGIYPNKMVGTRRLFVQPNLRRLNVFDSCDVTNCHKISQNVTKIGFFWGNRQPSILRVTVHRQKSFTENIRNSIVTPLRIATS